MWANFRASAYQVRRNNDAEFWHFLAVQAARAVAGLLWGVGLRGGTMKMTVLKHLLRLRCIKRSREKFPRAACLAALSLGAWVGPDSVGLPLGDDFPGRGDRTVKFGGGGGGGGRCDGECGTCHAVRCSVAFFFHLLACRWPSAEAFWRRS